MNMTCRCVDGYNFRMAARNGGDLAIDFETAAKALPARNGGPERLDSVESILACGVALRPTGSQDILMMNLVVDFDLEAIPEGQIWHPKHKEHRKMGFDVALKALLPGGSIDKSQTSSVERFETHSELGSFLYYNILHPFFYQRNPAGTPRLVTDNTAYDLAMLTKLLEHSGFPSLTRLGPSRYLPSHQRIDVSQQSLALDRLGLKVTNWPKREGGCHIPAEDAAHILACLEAVEGVAYRHSL